MYICTVHLIIGKSKELDAFLVYELRDFDI